MVALKVLKNSKGITLKFLQEIANIGLVARKDSSGNVVNCYGISQYPNTKNYVMVMRYMEDGNLREYLKNKNNDLSLEDKLQKLTDISCGLKRIHEKGLIHRDLHSGNIVNGKLVNKNQSFITDLGLSYPAGYQKQEGKLYGILLYLAPELLK